jgi:hypothetical protein
VVEDYNKKGVGNWKAKVTMSRGVEIDGYVQELISSRDCSREKNRFL